MLYGKPPDEFVKVNISLIIVELFDGHHYSTDN